MPFPLIRSSWMFELYCPLIGLAWSPHVMYTVPVGQNPTGVVRINPCLVQELLKRRSFVLNHSRLWGLRGRRRSTISALSLVSLHPLPCDLTL